MRSWRRLLDLDESETKIGQLGTAVHQQSYEANCNQFIASIDALYQQLRATFADHQGLEFMVFHPSWGYFADAYGLSQVPIELEGKHPKPAQLQAFDFYCKSCGQMDCLPPESLQVDSSPLQRSFSRLDRQGRGASGRHLQ